MKWNMSTVKKLLNAFREGNTIISACKIAGITRMTFYRWIAKSPKLELRIEKLKTNRNSLVVDALYAKALKGDTTACKAWLQNKANWKFTETKIDVNASASAGAEAKAEVVLEPAVVKNRLQHNIGLIKRFGLLDLESVESSN